MWMLATIRAHSKASWLIKVKSQTVVDKTATYSMCLSGRRRGKASNQVSYWARGTYDFTPISKEEAEQWLALVALGSK